MTGPSLERRLGLADAVVIGLGSMIGAGVFVALAPAAAAAGTGLLVGLAVAAVVAYCNATSSARLAARYPQSGGSYVYGRERLGEFWGYLAGWGFVAGKTASCAAMALTVGYYTWPAQAHAIAVATVAVLTAINYVGVKKSALVTRVIVAVVLVVLAVVVVVVFTSGAADFGQVRPGGRLGGVLRAAGILFFAFAGYARIATLGEEVHDPARTIPRAIPLALGITLAVYAAVAVAALSVLGSDGLARHRSAGRGGQCCRSAGIRAGGAGRRSRGGGGVAAGVDSRGVPHDARDGTRSSSAAWAFGCARAVQGTAPRGVGGRRHCRGCCRVRRRPRSDRLFLVRGAGLLRSRERVGVDSGASADPNRRAGGLPGAGVRASADVRAVGGRGARGRRGDLCRAAIPHAPVR